MKKTSTNLKCDGVDVYSRRNENTRAMGRISRTTEYTLVLFTGQNGDEKFANAFMYRDMFNDRKEN